MRDGRSCLQQWRDAVAQMPAPLVVELGTRAWDGRPPRHHRDEIMAVNASALWRGVDLEAGDGVDVVADVHEIDRHFGAASVDAVFAASVLEHFRRPWIAAAALAKIVKPGGLIFVQTHQAFPLHFFPLDYFRFSREALGELFAEDAGWRVLDSEYQFPCRVLPLSNCFAHALDWNFVADAWINVEMLAERI